MECKDCKRTDVRCCNTCAKDSSKCEVWHDCGAHCKEHKSKPKTNADKIRNMTDEELAEFLSCDCDDVINCKDCKEPVNEYGSCSGLCRYEYLRWLKSEVGCE